MKNTKLLPFERNRYFTGKMLTSSDFAAEQTYSNNKRRFLNSILYGAGIICGLNVSCVDERSISISSGVAFDAYGREVVVPESTIVKLSSLEGFEHTTTDKLILALRYSEKNIQPVYAVSKKEKSEEYEYNRVSERYELIVHDSDMDVSFTKKNDFMITKTLIDTDDYNLQLCVPSVVCAGNMTKILLTLTKKNDEKLPFVYDALIQFPSFIYENNHETGINFDVDNMKRGEQYTKEIWVEVQNAENTDASILIKDSNVTCAINNIPVLIDGDILISLQIEFIKPSKLISKKLALPSYEDRTKNIDNDEIKLAQLLLERHNNSYEISSVITDNVRSYLNSPADLSDRMEYLDFFREVTKNGRLTNNSDETENDIKNGIISNNSVITSGIVEIPVGRLVKKKTVLYSDEIVHGLGKGNVYITLANQINSCFGDKNESFTMLGEKGIFTECFPNDSFQTAVKILNNKGSFIVGVKALEDVECTTISYRWYATNFNNSYEKQANQIAPERRIHIDTPTIILEPKESHYFNVRFENMDPTQIGYELCESNSGTISMEGLYTAPAHEGVYEIKIYCLNEPVICTYAYAIVKRKS